MEVAGRSQKTSDGHRQMEKPISQCADQQQQKDKSQVSTNTAFSIVGLTKQCPVLSASKQGINSYETIDAGAS